ncbi:glycosyltransferase [Methanocorpusculum bavaricum]|uniref:glycosyltransferase n=1 Tax=Methanocorpusculum bavaricum TaxID=71518 RepID=UPI0005B2B420|nr:glycosyltransferase [Methanocorpusculum bavaricum]
MIDLFILSGTYIGGGAEKVAETLGNNLPETISRQLIALHKVDDCYDLKYDVITLSNTTSKSNIIRCLKLPVLTLKYILLIKKYHPKVSLSMLLEDNLINIFSSIVTKSIPIISIHWMPNRKFSMRNKILQKLMLSLVRLFNIKVIAVSHGVKNELILGYGLYAENITMIYNPVNIENIKVLGEMPVNEDMFEANVLTIITVGRLTDVKGQWHLVRVFSELHKIMSCRLIICGDGPLRNYLRKLVNQLEIDNDVYFLGWCSNPYKYMAKSDVFILTSSSESFGNVLVEAMACGVPVIASNCSPAMEEILGTNGEYGLLTQKMTDKKYSISDGLDSGEIDLKNKIMQLINNRDLQEKLSINGKERAQDFSMDLSLKEYTRLLSSYYD